ncbi:MAG: hypothetical protein ABSF87_05870 [Xanthobacteraceae bacterium]
MLNLSSAHRLQIQATARMVRAPEVFVASVMAELARHRLPITDAAVDAAIADALSGDGDARCYFTDSQEETPIMGRTFNVDEIDDDGDIRFILRSGDKLRVPMALMDESPTGRAAIEAAKRSTYRAGERLGLHKQQGGNNMRDTRFADGSANRPGFRFADGKPRATDHYAQYDADLEAAFKRGDDVVGFGERGTVGQRDGDLCTIDGRSGTLRTVDGKLKCVANDDSTSDAMSAKDHQQRMAKLYQLRDAELREAWRAGKNEPRDASPVRATDGRSHQQTMDELYRARDAELANAWRS